MTPTLGRVNVRRTLVAAVLLLAAPVLSSCGVGFNAQTNQVYQPAEGVNDRSGQVDVLNALVVSGSDGSGTVIATLVNNSQTTADTLQNVAGAGSDTSLQVTLGGDTSIPADGMLNLADSGKIFVAGERVKAGYLVSLTFTFANASAVTLSAPVVPASKAQYSGVPLPPAS